MVPAIAASVTLSPLTRSLASTITPIRPTISAINRRSEIASRHTAKATTAVNNGVIELAIAPTPAGARSAPHANSVNGIAELSSPTMARRIHNTGEIAPRERHKNGDSDSAPSVMRTWTRAIGPKSPAATRMNRNEPPQIAPSATSSMGVIQSVCAAVAGRSIVFMRSRREERRIGA